MGFAQKVKDFIAPDFEGEVLEELLGLREAKAEFDAQKEADLAEVTATGRKGRNQKRKIEGRKFSDQKRLDELEAEFLESNNKRKRRITTLVAGGVGTLVTTVGGIGVAVYNTLRNKDKESVIEEALAWPMELDTEELPVRTEKSPELPGVLRVIQDTITKARNAQIQSQGFETVQATEQSGDSAFAEIMKRVKSEFPQSGIETQTDFEEFLERNGVYFKINLNTTIQWGRERYALDFILARISKRYQHDSSELGDEILAKDADYQRYRGCVIDERLFENGIQFNNFRGGSFSRTRMVASIDKHAIEVSLQNKKGLPNTVEDEIKLAMRNEGAHAAVEAGIGKEATTYQSLILGQEVTRSQISELYSDYKEIMTSPIAFLSERMISMLLTNLNSNYSVNQEIARQTFNAVGVRAFLGKKSKGSPIYDLRTLEEMVLEGDREALELLKKMRDVFAQKTKALVEECNRVSESHTWQKEYDITYGPFEKDERIPAVNAERIAIARILSAVRDFNNRPEDAFETEEDARRVMNVFFGQLRNSILRTWLATGVTYNGTIADYLLSRGFLFSAGIYPVSQEPLRYGIMLELNEIALKGDISLSEKICDEEVRIDTTVNMLGHELIPDERIQNYGSHSAGQIWVHREEIRAKSEHEKFGISQDDFEKGIIANEAGHALFAQRFPQGENWTFVDPILGNLDRETVTEIYSDMYEIESIPLALFPAKVFLMWVSQSFRPAYKASWDLMERSMDSVKLGEYLKSLNIAQSNMENLWIYLARRVQSGDQAIMNSMKLLREEFLKNGRAIINSGKGV